MKSISISAYEKNKQEHPSAIPETTEPPAVEPLCKEKRELSAKKQVLQSRHENEPEPDFNLKKCFMIEKMPEAHR